MDTDMNMEYLIQEIEDWKERALTAEARASNLERKLAGEKRRNDPREKIERRLKKRKYNHGEGQVELDTWSPCRSVD